MPSKNTPSLVDCTCQHCGKLFQITQSAARQGRGKNCSVECQRAASKKQTQVQCEVCQSSFSVKASRKSKARYCSMKCRNVADSMKRPHNYLGPKRESMGYIVVDHPSGKGRVYEHRLVAEQMIGRPLRSDEHVHHVNENRSDNRPENLMVLSNSEHMSIHNKISKWARHYDACIDCGTESRRHEGHGLCGVCAYRRKNASP